MKENWIETSVKYDKVIEDGTTKSVTEKYWVSALSFTEAETNITEEMKHYGSCCSYCSLCRGIYL